MIITFRAIVASGTSDPRLMAQGIGQAMIATVLGLGIAIPLLFINAGLASLSRAVTQTLDEQSQALLAKNVQRNNALRVFARRGRSRDPAARIQLRPCSLLLAPFPRARVPQHAGSAGAPMIAGFAPEGGRLRSVGDSLADLHGLVWIDLLNPFGRGGDDARGAARRRHPDARRNAAARSLRAPLQRRRGDRHDGDVAGAHRQRRSADGARGVRARRRASSSRCGTTSRACSKRSRSAQPSPISAARAARRCSLRCSKRRSIGMTDILERAEEEVDGDFARHLPQRAVEIREPRSHEHAAADRPQRRSVLEHSAWVCFRCSV